jgi:hypothetical protein
MYFWEALRSTGRINYRGFGESKILKNQEK